MEPTPICWKRLCLLGLSCAIGIYTGISLACQLRGESRVFPKYSSAAQAPHPTYPIKEWKPGRMMFLPLLFVSLALGAPMNVVLPASASDSHAFNYIVTILMENHDLSEIIGSASAPFMNQLASSWSLATGYSAVNHPSLPNYLSLVSGQDFASWSASDCSPGPGCSAGNATNIVDSLEANGLTWKAYMEDYPLTCTNNCSPGNCYPREGSALHRLRRGQRRPPIPQRPSLLPVGRLCRQDQLQLIQPVQSLLIPENHRNKLAPSSLDQQRPECDPNAGVLQPSTRWSHGHHPKQRQLMKDHGNSDQSSHHRVL